MKDRLVEFMKCENISSAKLAEIAGVQPSAISHILSGRNKPGFDFLANLIAHYPELNTRWLMLGKGDIFNMDVVSRAVSNVEEDIKVEIPEDLFNILPNKTIGNKTTDLFNHVNQIKSSSGREIERIVILYNDGSFSSYE